MSNFRPVEEPHERERREGPASAGINIGGTHVPYWALGAGALIVGFLGFLVWRQFHGTGTTSSQAQQAVGTASLTPMGASGTPTGQYDVVPTPYPNANTTVGATPAQTSGLGLTASDGTSVAGTVQTPTTGPILTPSTGGYPIPVTNQIYWVSGSGSDLGTSVSNSNPSAQSLAPSSATAPNSTATAGP